MTSPLRDLIAFAAYKVSANGLLSNSYDCYLSVVNVIDQTLDSPDYAFPCKPLTL